MNPSVVKIAPKVLLQAINQLKSFKATGLFLSWKQDQLTLAINNSDGLFKLTVPTIENKNLSDEVGEMGITVDFVKFNRIVSSYPKDHSPDIVLKIDVKQGDVNELVIRFVGLPSKYRMNQLDSSLIREKINQHSNVNNVKNLTLMVNGKYLCEKLANASQAMGKQESIYMLNGVCLSLNQLSEQPELFVYATNKILMNFDKISFQTKTPLTIDERSHVVLPATCVSPLMTLLSNLDDEDVVEIDLMDRKIVLKYQGIFCDIDGLDCTYPSLETRPREQKAFFIDMDKGVLENALKRTLIITQEDRNKVVSFALKENLLCLSSDNTKQEKAEELLDMVFYQADQVDFTVDCKFLLRLLTAIKSDQVRLAFNPRKVSEQAESLYLLDDKNPTMHNALAFFMK